MRFRRLITTSLLLMLAGCASSVQSNPPRTATEQLLISVAAEHAAAKLALGLPAGSKVFVDNGNFEGTDSKNAVGAIRTSLLQQGLHLVDDRKNADAIVETRAGALSIDRNSFLIGIPQFNIPVPFSSTPFSFPEIALYSRDDQMGVAKFAVTASDAKQGKLLAAPDPQYGFSHNVKKTVMIFISWSDSDALPDNVDPDAKDDQAQTRAPHPEIPVPPTNAK